ncbi:Cytochrome P450 alkane hydroxylase, putative [Penicillium digitatum]|uniref:Cytochrome P450 alkane hydroxylase, putative n=3 Tax=Penicillium digitatum TaxID=36651 RepID=K9FUK2_PEND2|nr:Cytochrome P450 alkane hydroxylase, putative [Penicillium digitatum Pd1]EKV13300.1 Cytochrome P450 alkane hydroxylase, putative [Penicillium digitatum PHI26]EKV19174.1 Cytochrome P450 alkane hydroxylase, putative [Penicillium digitatum Pd1]QQK42933.1 Cytochrome P450 alkane hydroxylase, putative [Penicillium digitatum]
MIEDFLTGMMLSKTSLLLLGLFSAFCVFHKFQASAQIARLGVRAPKIEFHLPYALDFIFQGYQANQVNRDMEFWDSKVGHAGGLTNVKTAELDAGMIITKDPENIKALLTGQFADNGKGESFHQEWKEFLGDSSFVTDGELWSRSRQLIRPMFVRDRIIDTEIFEKHVQKLIPLLGGSSSLSSSKIVDV